MTEQHQEYAGALVPEDTVMVSAETAEIFFDRPIAYHRIFAYITGYPGAAVFLSQAWYWSKRTTDPEGWFYKTAYEWREETGLTEYQQRHARKWLKKLGILEEKKKGLPAQLYFKIDKTRVYQLCDKLSSSCKTSEQEPNKLQFLSPQNFRTSPRKTRGSLYTESTTENRSENTNRESPENNSGRSRVKANSQLKKGETEKQKDSKSVRRRRAKNLNKIDVEHQRLAVFMWQQWVQERTKQAKEPDIQKWADVFRLMNEKDCIDIADMYTVMSWVRDDKPNGNGWPGWGAVILSPEKLRKQWGNLVAHGALNGHNGSKPYKQGGTTQEDIEKFVAEISNK